MPFATKSHKKENAKASEHPDGDKLFGRQPLSSHRRPEIHFHPELSEAIEMSSSFAADVFNTCESLQQATRDNKLAYIRQYSITGHDLNVTDGTGFTALHQATSANNVEAMSLLLDCRAEVNCPGEQLLTPLHMAVRYNRFEAVEMLMKHNADPSMQNADGATPLHFAAHRGCADICKLLLSNALSCVNCPDNSGITPFHLACVSGSLELCEMFMGRKADIRARTVEEKIPLHLAALYGNNDIVEFLIKKALDQFDDATSYINALDFEGNTPLHLACIKGHVEAGKLLLSFGADVVDGEKHGCLHSPLHLAAANGHMTVVELLISHNASVDCRDELERTPLHRAAEFDRLEVVKYLLTIGADIEAKDNANRTAFVWAVKRGRTRAAQLLLESGADFKSRDESLRTCMHLAVQYEREDTLRMLLERDQDKLTNGREKDLQTPLHYAAQLGFLKILKLLLKNKSTVARDVFERTPLHAAAKMGHVRCVEELCLSEPGHINDKDERGRTPLHQAARQGHRKTCSVLIHMGARIMIRDINRWTALHHCAVGGCARTAEALLVYHFTLPMEATDQDGNTPLHVAAKWGHVSIVELMVSRGADITVCNKRKMTCLDEAIECGKEKVAEVLLKNNKWKDILQYKADRKANPMKSLIQNMPKLAEKVMDRCITYSELPRLDPEYTVTFDFSLLACDGERKVSGKRKHFFGPVTMVESEREDLLMHPLSQALLQWKWITLGKPLFWCNFLTYFSFVCLLTVFTVTERVKQHVHSSESVVNTTDTDPHGKIFRDKSAFSTGVPVAIVIFICIHMLKEIYQITVQKWRYITHFTNLTEWCCYITALCYIAPYLMGEMIFPHSLALWPWATTVIFLSFTSLSLFLRRFSSFGIYITMFLEVTRTFVKVIFIFTPIIFSFSLAFFLLLKEQDSFFTPWWSFLKTIMMMVGEIDYDSIIVEAKKERSKVTGALLAPIPEYAAIVVFFLCLMVSVLLMNFLVGLAVGDIDSIQRNAKMRRLAMQVEFVTDIDQRYPRFWRKYCNKSVLVLKPNQKNKLAFLFGMKVNLFPKTDSCTDERSIDDVITDDESGKSKVLAVVAKQRNEIKLLKNAIEDQSRLLQEISHQLKQAERPSDTTVSSA